MSNKKKETINILIIEDDNEDAEIIKENIEDNIQTYKCAFKIVASGEDALAEFGDNPNYDIIFADEVIEGDFL
ncbi:MAG: hypothetical protein KAW12_21345 [Candidatus Aminicenantes bacterium]|nr:hypothetical protein [Candidatus Aminicenantes bacterium]